MSRAFVRESDAPAESLPERIASNHPNLVTAAGLQQIEAAVLRLEAEGKSARNADDKAQLARLSRDLRYWKARRASARVVESMPAPASVRFGARVRLRYDDGSERAFRLVGEDEADPARDLLSWVAPLALALTGRAAGDSVDFQGRVLQILSIEGDP